MNPAATKVNEVKSLDANGQTMNGSVPSSTSTEQATGSNGASVAVPEDSQKQQPKHQATGSNGASVAVPEDSQKQQPKHQFPDEREAGFTRAEHDAAIKVLEILFENKAVYDKPAMRPLRKVIFKYTQRDQQKLFGGVHPSEYRKNKRAYKEGIVLERKKLKHDQEMLNKRQLRLARLNQLKALTATNPNLPLIPDGAVDDGTGLNKSVGQAGGASSVPLILTENGESSQTGEASVESKNADTLKRFRSCYVCKVRFRELHNFYDQLCPTCAALSWEKRQQSANLNGRVALVTGGRVKIGYQIALKLLRAGARVIVTTRFPADAALRFAREEDYPKFKGRLSLFGVDFRDIAALESFAGMLNRTLDRLDVIVNNACQTIRRPPAYYRHLLENEAKAVKQLKFVKRSLKQGALSTSNESNSSATLPFDGPQAAYETIVPGSHHGLVAVGGIALSDRKHELVEDIPLNESEGTKGKETSNSSANKSSEHCTVSEINNTSSNAPIPSALLSQLPLVPEDNVDDAALFPVGTYDVNAQQIDLRKENSWRLKLSQVSTTEVVEVMAVNTIAPLVLNARLKELMVRTGAMDESGGSGLEDIGRYIVNVSAMEGKFYRFKNSNHPHTNMAKAALNMMTRTSGADYKKSGIYMNSVDTGWINDENPLEIAAKIASKNNFQTPIDEVDAAARVLDPVFAGVKQKPEERPFGIFLKDFHETEW